ncbi:SSD domain-containing protein [Chloropicon primus]|uniref:SSD domain-containing protein n=1 Tax=Chloropicon primus TaxID=1764295 RepID=A0A5B8MG19_9CHLO|nr:hypothetical protein A3770_02p19140 [Chloropicon primus]UPQ98605.1 SSD domain-containing protein [Chloropicon primus]|eukprot:QDZ19396.1 hypothetical protein A3770_02p19140 [Chloropicon primus]
MGYVPDQELRVAATNELHVGPKVQVPVQVGPRPNVLVRFLARRPCLVMVLSLLFALGLSAVGMIVGEFEISADNDGWNSRNTPVADKQAQDSARLNLWARLNGEEEDYRRRRHLLQESSHEFNAHGDQAFHGENHLLSLYKGKGKDFNLLNMQSLKEVCEYEAEVFRVQEESDVCRRARDDESWPIIAGECFHPISFVTLIREDLILKKYTHLNYPGKKPWFTCDTLFSEYTATWLGELVELYVSEAKVGPSVIPEHYFASLTGKDIVNDGRHSTNLLRTVFPMREGSLDAVYALHKSGKLKGNGDYSFDLAYDVGDAELTDLLIDDVLSEDMIMACAATAIILFLIWFHTRSVFMAFVGVIQVALSFPSAYFAYKLLLGFSFFPFLNFLAMFVVMGIGADDIFVLFDKFEQAAQSMPGASAYDLACVAIPQASYAMLLTSLTTAGAFFSTAITPVAPIRMFAVFLGMMTVFDYLFVIIICAPALVLQIRWVQAIKAKGAHVGRYFKLSLLDFSQACSRKDKKHKKETMTQKILVQCAKGTTALRYFLVPGLLALFIYFTLVSLDIPMPQTSEVQLFPDNHIFTKWTKWKNDLYVGDGEETSWVRVIFGLKPGDTGNENDPTSKSKIILDPTFDITQPAVQTWMLEFCQDIKQQTFTTDRGDCFMDGFDQWLKGRYNPATSKYDLSLPLPSDQFNYWFLEWRSQRDHRRKHIGIASEIERSYHPESGQGAPPPPGQEQVEFLVMNIEATVKWNDPYNKLKSQFYEWSEYIDKKRLEAPQGTSDSFFFISEDFHWWDTNRQMKNSAYLSALLSVAMATVIIFVSNGNVLLTLYSVISIFCILVTVAATTVAMGWSLGFLEAICFAILVGLSCDFIVHIAHAYKESKEETRREKTLDAIWAMGPPVLYAAVSTSLAGALLFNCTILFYTKFGAVLLFTMAYSFLMIFVFLAPLLVLAGPVGNFMNAYALFYTKKEEEKPDQAKAPEAEAT